MKNTRELIDKINTTSLFVVLSFDKNNGKKKLIDVHFPTETLRDTINKAFISNK